jgi:4-hydroxybenzoate polyprenyltransferase
LLGVAGLILCWAVNVALFCTGLSLLIMGVLYNVRPVRLKEVAYVDVLSESVNNPIRLLLGWFALTTDAVPPVSLMIAYWMVGAFFMAAKRFAEYRSIADPEAARAYRASFGYYNEQRLLISMFFYTTTCTLFLGVFIIRYHVELILSFPLIAGFLCVYLRVAFRRDSAAQKPERLYREKKLMASLAISVLAFVVLMFTHIPACYTWFNVPASSVTPLWKLGATSVEEPARE